MTTQFNPEFSLKNIKSRISNMDPLTADTLEIEFLYQNTIEILISQNEPSQALRKAITDIMHTYNKEVRHAVNETSAQRIIDEIGRVKVLTASEFPVDNFSIESLPEDWSTPPVIRAY